MFDKLRQGKELLKLRSQAKQLQQELEQIRHSEEEDGVRVVVNGAQSLIGLEVDGVDQEKLVRIINKTMKEVQKKAAKRMMELGGGLSGLLGGLK